MSGGTVEGHGVQVVGVTSEHKYELNLDVLEGILLREDVRNRWVVVVSIAGAYRGGKSFILSFFLRYLLASPANQMNGQWLGFENQPLTGFSWRGGSERNTIGILFWSEPIHATLPTGEKVVIILMDTQGTFDSASTMRDCSTIFALSTLLSSVQIYNISQNIKEDDLYHLQLFTEYGRLVQDRQQDSKAFQVLQFLVRDWSFPYEYPYGIIGGNKLLEKRLEIAPNQPAELRELREHISSCFETLTGFLMPHPGLEVSKPDFNGCLSDIREEFKSSLLELVPAIFAPANLTPKMIGGQRVKARELLLYIKTYMNVFNSDDLPAPVNILQATTDACLLAAVMEARDLYETQMESNCGASQPSVSRAALLQLHTDAIRAAKDAFGNKKMMGSQANIDAELNKVSQELESRLPGYISINEAKTRKAILDAKEAYDTSIRAVHGSNQLCLHPDDLEKKHSDTVREVMTTFNARRNVAPNEVDEAKEELIKHFASRIDDLRRSNGQCNEAAMSASRDVYVSYMESGPASLSPAQLAQRHEKAREKAIKAFRAKRNIDNTQPDSYTELLIENIEAYLQRLKVSNKKSSKGLVQSVMFEYNNSMSSVCGSRCLHPEELRSEHEHARSRALAEFDSVREHRDDDDPDRNKLIEDLQRRYTELCETNATANKWAVEAAYTEYCRRMDNSSRPALSSILIVPLVVKIISMPDKHKRASSAALELFWNRRRNRKEYDSDCYLDELTAKLKAGYDLYCNPGHAIAREVGLPLPNE